MDKEKDKDKESKNEKAQEDTKTSWAEYCKTEPSPILDNLTETTCFYAGGYNQVQEYDKILMTYSDIVDATCMFDVTSLQQKFNSKILFQPNIIYKTLLKNKYKLK